MTMSLVRAGIRALLERIQGVEVLAEAGDGRSFGPSKGTEP